MDDPQTFERLTQFFKDSGMQRNMAKVLAYLLICEPPRQSAGSIEKALSLSKGSVNTALNSLLLAKLIISYHAQKGRYLEYELDKDAWLRAVIYRVQSMQTIIAIADKGIRNNPRNERLIEMRTVYDMFFQHFKDYLDSLPPSSDRP